MKALGAIVAMLGIGTFGTLAGLFAVLMTLTVDFGRWLAGEE